MARIPGNPGGAADEEEEEDPRSELEEAARARRRFREEDVSDPANGSEPSAGEQRAIDRIPDSADPESADDEISEFRQAEGAADGDGGAAADRDTTDRMTAMDAFSTGVVGDVTGDNERPSLGPSDREGKLVPDVTSRPSAQDVTSTGRLDVPSGPAPSERHDLGDVDVHLPSGKLLEEELQERSTDFQETLREFEEDLEITEGDARMAQLTDKGSVDPGDVDAPIVRGAGQALDPFGIAASGKEIAETGGFVAGGIEGGDLGERLNIVAGQGAVAAQDVETAVSERPIQTGAAALTGFAVGTGAVRAGSKVAGGARSTRVRAAADAEVDFADITSEKGLRGELPNFRTDPDAPTAEAVSEVRTRAADNPDVVTESTGADRALFHSTEAELPDDLDVMRGQSELPGLFTSPDASPLRLTEGAESGGSLTPRLPRLSDFTGDADRLAGFPGDRIEGMPPGATGAGRRRTGEGFEPDPTTSGAQFLDVEAEAGTAFVRPTGGRTTELEAILPPGSKFEQTGTVAVNMPSGRAVPLETFRRVDADTAKGDAGELMTGGEILDEFESRSRSGSPEGEPVGTTPTAPGGGSGSTDLSDGVDQDVDVMSGGSSPQGSGSGSPTLPDRSSGVSPGGSGTSGVDPTPTDPGISSGSSGSGSSGGPTGPSGGSSSDPTGPSGGSPSDPTLPPTSPPSGPSSPSGGPPTSPPGSSGGSPGFDPSDPVAPAEFDVSFDPKPDKNRREFPLGAFERRFEYDVTPPEEVSEGFDLGNVDPDLDGF